LTRRLKAWSKGRDHDDLGSFSTVDSIEASSRNEHGRPTVLRLKDRRGRTADLTIAEFLAAANFNGRGSGQRPSKPLWSGWATGELKRGRVQLEGHGFGHGVGLCQYGAQALGMEGRSYQEILSWYYPGAEIHQSW
jgi:stage II sporulation protein D